MKKKTVKKADDDDVLDKLSEAQGVVAGRRPRGINNSWNKLKLSKWIIKVQWLRNILMDLIFGDPGRLKRHKLYNEVTCITSK